MSNCEIKIRFSKDELKAYADFIPASGEGAELTDLYAKSVLSEAGIKIGIDWDGINSTIESCNSSHKSKIGLVIATGIAPVSEVEPYWKLEEKFFNHAMSIDEDALKVDFREVSNFTLVKKGELIAVRKPGRSGVDGQNVKGDKIPFTKKKIVQFKSGEHTAEHEGRLYAATSGRYEVTDSREIHINDTLHIEGDVDYSTGNISFSKDVIIEGEVKDGFKVAAGGSLFCKKNLDASDVICRKDLIVDHGIIGRGTATILVGGLVTAKFIENCQIESKKGIDVVKNIMNSKVYTLGDLKLGDKSSLVSSHVCVEKNIIAFNIGKEGSPHSKIEVGSSFINKRMADSIKMRIDVLQEKYNHLNGMAEYRKTEKKLKLITQIGDVISRGREELKDKLEFINEHPEAVVLVKGTIYPGNVISICGNNFSVTEKLSKIKFYFNQESQRVEYVPL